ncbi:Kef-type K+ transport system, membrane component KefB [Collimonas sp. OK242]|uniref:cation:proton antiporter n=1 Tax=Collimonas sp. OK242 TaxID=1798195 RepID=UPI0008970705|nr:cation:proton antiporter [Collimonas sp. OK242]SDX60720.1 Kef-type K+ transport system, membrane component KefB [Collimonas sp. OK242]
MAMWPIQLCIIILATMLCGALAKRIGQSRVVGEIAAGLILGPAVLGAINTDLYNMLFSNAVMPVISQFGELGLVLLMFQLGLHLDLKSLQGRVPMRMPVTVALSGIVFPFAIGCALAAVSRSALAPEVPALGYVLFCGVALSISAMPVMVRIVLDLQMEGTFTATVALTAASLTDLLGWLLLAVITAISTGGFTWEHIARNVALLLIFVAVSMLIVRPLWTWVIAGRAASRVTSRVLPAVICYVLISSWITAEIGFHSAFGALMAGLVLRDLPGLKIEWRDKVEGFVALILMPVFFALAGIQAASGNVSLPNFWLWFSLFLIGGIAGKFGGSYLGARMAGVGHRDASVIGALMNTRGLMELIVLTIGLKLGILPPSVYTMLFVMALATTAMTVPVLRLFGYGSQRDERGTDGIPVKRRDA